MCPAPASRPVQRSGVGPWHAVRCPQTCRAVFPRLLTPTSSIAGSDVVWGGGLPFWRTSHHPATQRSNMGACTRLPAPQMVVHTAFTLAPGPCRRLVLVNFSTVRGTSPRSCRGVDLGGGRLGRPWEEGAGRGERASPPLPRGDPAPHGCRQDDDERPRRLFLGGFRGPVDGKPVERFAPSG